jgi:aminoglycoside/choline kinase family phosphotransferase
MGTTTFFLKLNDLGKPLNKMSKEELEKLANLSPYAETSHYAGWHVPLELHNGNVYVLVFWKGRLMKIEEAPKALNNKYYSKHLGKEVNEYEWTVLKKYMLAEIQRLDKEFKKSLRKNKTCVKGALMGRKGR